MSSPRKTEDNVSKVISSAAIVLAYILLAYSLGSLISSDNIIEFDFKIFLFFIVALAIIILTHMSLLLVTNKEVRRRFKFPQVLAFHVCNKKKNHSLVILGRTIPMCARHFGFYISFFIISIILLLIPKLFGVAFDGFSETEDLAIYLIMLFWVFVEGVLGKNNKINVSNWVRFLGGIITPVGWLFLALFFMHFVGINPLRL